MESFASETSCSPASARHTVGLPGGVTHESFLRHSVVSHWRGGVTTLKCTRDRGFQGVQGGRGCGFLCPTHSPGRPPACWPGGSWKPADKASTFQPGEEERDNFLFMVSPNGSQCDLSLSSVRLDSRPALMREGNAMEPTFLLFLGRKFPSLE